MADIQLSVSDVKRIFTNLKLNENSEKFFQVLFSDRILDLTPHKRPGYADLNYVSSIPDLMRLSPEQVNTYADSLQDNQYYFFEKLIENRLKSIQKPSYEVSDFLWGYRWSKVFLMVLVLTYFKKRTDLSGRLKGLREEIRAKQVKDVIISAKKGRYSAEENAFFIKNKEFKPKDLLRAYNDAFGFARTNTAIKLKFYAMRKKEGFASNYRYSESENRFFKNNYSVGFVEFLNRYNFRFGFKHSRSGVERKYYRFRKAQKG